MDRSMRAGVETPATPIGIVQGAHPHAGMARSMRAGVETPATPGGYLLPRDWSAGSASLNEGRGRNPGNTIAWMRIVKSLKLALQRSMRAGVETPATPCAKACTRKVLANMSRAQ